MLAADPTAPEITGADAERMAEIRRALDDRVDAEEFGAWVGHTLDEVVDDLLPLHVALEHREGYCVDIFFPIERSGETLGLGESFAGLRQGTLFEACKKPGEVSR